MKKHIGNITLLILPFIFMIIINEVVRPGIKEKPYSKSGITAINSSGRIADKCTWICHNQTNYCKEHHVTFNKRFFIISDPMYFGVIGLLRSTGNYGLANIIILVVLIPLLMWFLLIKSLGMQIEINKLKKDPE